MAEITQASQEAPPEEIQAESRGLTGGYLLSFGLVAALLGLLAWGLIKVQRGPVDRGMAPDFTLTSFDGETLTLSELRGQVVVINFWASWCPPCRMSVDQESAPAQTVWEGITYYFCANGCREDFLKAPDRYRPSVLAQGDARK